MPAKRSVHASSGPQVSGRMGEILEVLASVKAAQPASLEAIRVARRAAINAVATRRGIRPRTVLDKCFRQLGLSSVTDFDRLVEAWFLRQDTSLERRLRRRSSVRAEGADELAIREFFSPAGSSNAHLTKSRYTPRAVIAPLKPFKPKADFDYMRYVWGGARVAQRGHETLVNQFAGWLSDRGFKPGSNLAVDLGLEHPPVIFEAEHVTSWPTSVREAVGQLYEYRYFQVARPDAALVFLASKPVPARWIRYLERDRGIAVIWRQGRTFLLTKLASKTLHKP